MSELSISVIIPAFNEAQAISSVIQGICRALESRVKIYEVLVVNDGSTDGTADAARQAGATVFSKPVNHGYGQALTTGIQAARHEWILMIDADGSYPTEDIPKLLPFIPAFDLVIGARTGAHFWGTRTQALRRRVYLKIAAFIVGEKVPDANSGLRLVRRSLALHTGPVECLGYSFSTTMTLSFLKAGHCVKYVPISFEARTGTSKVRPIRDILRTLQLMAQVMIAYNPLKLFVTLGMAFAAMAVFFGIGYGLKGWSAWLISCVLCVLAALQCFIAGCVLDSIRMHRRS